MDFRESITAFNDNDLLDQYVNRKDDYTPEAVVIMEEEIKRRNLDPDAFRKEQTAEKPIITTLDVKDFIKFDHFFSHTDILLVNAILRDGKLPFYIDNPTSTDTIPIESEAQKTFTIHVHKDYEEKAHALLDEHFEKKDGKYLLRYNSNREKLKAFSFHEVHLSEQDAAEELEISFSAEEKKYLLNFGRKLLDEADIFEKEQDRVLFYYDNLESFIDKMESGAVAYTKSDLLTMLEILQVFCGTPEYPESLDGTAGALLGLFTG